VKLVRKSADWKILWPRFGDKMAGVKGIVDRAKGRVGASH